MIEATLGGFFLITMTTAALYQVFMRYVINRPSTWSEDAAIQSFAWLVMIGAAYAFNRREHVVMDLILNYLPGRARSWIALLSDVLVLSIAVYTFQVSFNYVNFIKVIKSPGGTGISWGWLFASLPVSMGFIAIHAMSHFLSDVERLQSLRRERR
ncbi:MAG: TRAP transporter small permease [Candidatus Bipolaricaulia bacterium]